MVRWCYSILLPDFDVVIPKHWFFFFLKPFRCGHGDVLCIMCFASCSCCTTELKAPNQAGFSEMFQQRTEFMIQSIMARRTGSATKQPQCIRLQPPCLTVVMMDLLWKVVLRNVLLLSHLFMKYFPKRLGDNLRCFLNKKFKTLCWFWILGYFCLERSHGCYFCLISVLSRRVALCLQNVYNLNV